MNQVASLPTAFGGTGLYTRDKAKNYQSASSGSYRASTADFIASFYAVLNRWRSETAFYSDTSKIISHDGFQEIIKNVDTVLPLIIGDLKTNPSLLVWALEIHYKERPYSQADRGNIRAMSEAWIAWAERNNGRRI